MQDFDLAFANELAARSAALVGDRERATEFIGKACTARRAIAEAEDRRIFYDDFFRYPWFGVDPGPRPAD